MTFYEKLDNAWFTITHPSYWAMNYNYDETFNDWLSESLKTCEFENVDERVFSSMMLNGKMIWVLNHPYASFTLQQSNVRASRKTIYTAHKKFIAFLLKPEMCPVDKS